MTRLAIPLLLLAAFALAGCGPDEPHVDEVSTPESTDALEETEQQRREATLDELEKKEAENFDAAEGQ